MHSNEKREWFPFLKITLCLLSSFVIGGRLQGLPDERKLGRICDTA